MALNPEDMAKRIEEFLDKKWQDAKQEPLSKTGRTDLRLLVGAIAAGVIEHLQTYGEVVLSEPHHKHDASCEVTISPSSGHYHDATCTPTIEEHAHTHTGKIK